MAYYTDSPAFQALWARAQGGSGAGSGYRPLGLSGIMNPRAKKSFMPPPPKPKPGPGLQHNQQNPYAFNVVASKTSNNPGGGDVFGKMGTGQDQAQSSQAQLNNANQEAQQQTALLNKGMSQAQMAAGNAGYTATPQPKPGAAQKAAPRRAAPAPRNLLQSREPGVGFGGIRPLMRF